MREPLRSTVLAMRARPTAADGAVTLSTAGAVGATIGLLLGGYAFIACLRGVCGRVLRRGIGDARPPAKQLVEITPRAASAPHAQPSS